MVTTASLATVLRTERAVVIECSEDSRLYGEGHIPGALSLDWKTLAGGAGSLTDHGAFAALAGGLGIDRDTTVILYGDRSNWWAACALWIFHLHGHSRAKLLDGGREKWIREARPLELEAVARPPAEYVPGRERRAPSLALQADVAAHLRAGRPLLDVRSPREFAGEISHPPEYPEEAPARAGTIPGALSLPWSLAVTESGCFRSAERLREIYEDVHGLRPDDDVIVYCRIGERSSHTWFVLTKLLGFRQVRNYTGGWKEWSETADVRKFHDA